MIYLTNINLNQNELQNAVIQPLAVAPSNPKLGQIYTDSASSKIKWFDGSEWKTIGVTVESSSTNGAITVDGVEMKVYELPIATADTLGGIIVGEGFTIDETGKLSVIQSKHYEVDKTAEDADDDASITRIVGENTVRNGDTCVVRTLISDDKYSYKAFVYADGNWHAMDGNYNAKNVYFDTDMVVTQSFGKYTTSSSVPNNTVPSNGLNLYEVLMDAYSEKKNPSKTAPSVSAFSVTGNGSSTKSFEIGTTVIPQWTSTFSAGSYTYKSTASKTSINPVSGTGVTATAWSIKQGTTEIGTVEDGTSASSIVIGDGNTTSISGTVGFTATADYSDGNYALTNLNTLPETDVRITSGTTAEKSASLTWVRNMFGGGTTEGTLTSAVIRGEKSATASAIASSAPFEFTAVAGDTKLFFAYPKAMTTKTPTFEIFTMAWGETSGFTSSEVEVADARGTNGDGTLNNAMTYTVWTYAPTGAFEAAETKYRVYFK